MRYNALHALLRALKWKYASNAHVSSRERQPGSNFAGGNAGIHGTQILVEKQKKPCLTSQKTILDQLKNLAIMRKIKMNLKLIKDLGMQTAGSGSYAVQKGLYKCYCGYKFEAWMANVKSGRTISCGCITKSALNDKNIKTAEYSFWANIKSRYLNRKSDFYEEDGERVIDICERWLNSFENFFEDMGVCTDGHTLERIDSKGNYTPENCKWIDNSKHVLNKTIQKNNKSGTTGVSFHSPSGSYQAYITNSGKKIQLGYFSKKEDAIKARHSAEILYCGKLKAKKR